MVFVDCNLFRELSSTRLIRRVRILLYDTRREGFAARELPVRERRNVRCSNTASQFVSLVGLPCFGDFNFFVGHRSEPDAAFGIPLETLGLPADCPDFPFLNCVFLAGSFSHPDAEGRRKFL